MHHKARRTANNTRTINSIAAPESVNLSSTQPAPGNRLDSSGYTNIEPLTCCSCNAQYYFTAGEQAFYAQKGYEDQPKACKKCRNLAKTDTSGKGWDSSTSAPATSSSGGWGSAGTANPPNAKDLWAASGRTWPPNADQLPKGKASDK